MSSNRYNLKATISLIFELFTVVIVPVVLLILPFSVQEFQLKDTNVKKYLIPGCYFCRGKRRRTWGHEDLYFTMMSHFFRINELTFRSTHERYCFSIF